MSFQVWLQANASRATTLPTPADVESAFAEAAVRRLPDGSKVVLQIDAETFDLAYDTTTDLVDHITVDRPTQSAPLWEGIYRLLSAYDMFLYWPGDELIAATARPGVPLPDDMPAERRVVHSTHELMALMENS